MTDKVVYTPDKVVYTHKTCICQSWSNICIISYFWQMKSHSTSGPIVKSPRVKVRLVAYFYRII